MNTLKNLILTAALSGMIAGPGLAYAQAAPDQTDPAQIARGAKAWADQCGRCHNVRAPAEFNDEDWYVAVTHMRVRGNIPGDVIRDIQAFLMATNKKKQQNK
ncbi:MAG: cytochrome c [Proteobacteria bacterium]|nr:cytochrome c [Pseudomonadota bacterium]